MRIVHKLYLKDFFLLLTVIVTGLSGIFSLIELIGRIDNFSDANPTGAELIRYGLYHFPRFMLYLLPMAVLVCVLFTFSQAFRRQEITTIKAAGGSLKRLFLPFIAAGVGLSIFAFLLGEFVSPAFTARAMELKNRLSGKDRYAVFREGAVWLKTKDGSPVKIDLYNPQDRTARGITVFVYGKNFLEKQITAASATWDGEAWLFSDVSVMEFETGRMKRSKTLRFEGLESPEVFATELKTPDAMGIIELSSYNRRLKEAGFSNTRLAVDLQTKFTFPLINIIMILLGIGLAVRGKTGGGFVSAALGLLISLAYWLSYTFTLSLGYAGVAPTIFAAWTVPVVFSAFSVYFYTKMPE